MTAWRKPAVLSTLVLGMRLGGAALVFAMQAALARAWGAGALGDYLLIIAIVNLVAFSMPLGFNVIGSYFAAIYAAQGEGRQALSFLLHAWRNVAGVALLVLAVGTLVSGEVGEGTLREVGWAAAVLATAMALVFVNGAVLIGLSSPLAGFAADVVFRPLVMMAGFIAAVSLGGPSATVATLIRFAALAYAAVAIVHAAIAYAAVRRLPAGGGPQREERRRWWRFAPPWAMLALATEFYFDIDLVIVAPLLPRQDFAVFAVCTRVFALIAFGVSAVYAVATPSVIAADAKKDSPRFIRRMTEANLLAAAFSAAAGLGALLFGAWLLRLFGASFVAGAAPLALMCVGLTIRSLMGPAPLVLSLHDWPYAALPATAAGLLALPLGNLLLVPAYGTLGAAGAAVISMTIWAVALWLTALKYTRLDVSVFPLMRGAFRS